MAQFHTSSDGTVDPNKPGPQTDHSNHTTRVLDPLNNMTAVENEAATRASLQKGGDATQAQIDMLKATKSYRR